jgi:uncharacterized protein (DUF2236 family)
MAIRETIHQPIPHVERPMADPPRLQPAKRRRRVASDYGLMGVALVAGPANVIMQLARPGVGYGVLESRVESGRVDLHPIKRARTTFTYLAVATAGSDAQKEAFRRAVNRAHAQVYSTPESPVQYNAFDLDLQLWVGACLYEGGVDIYRTFIGELDDADADRHYREGTALATTLQVPPQMWPADRAAFDRYWQDSLAKLHIDDAVRDYLYPIAAGRMRGVAPPRPLQRLSDSFALLITTGFLPQRFREVLTSLQNSPAVPPILKNFLAGISNDTVAHDPTVDNPIDNLVSQFLQNFGINWNPAEGTVNGLDYDAYTDPGQLMFWVVRSLELFEDFQQFGVYLTTNPVLAFQYLVSLELFDWPTHIAEIALYLASQPEVWAAAIGAAVAPLGSAGGFAGLAGLAALPQPAVVPAPAPVAAAPNLLPVLGSTPIAAPAAAPASAPAPAPTQTASTVASSAPPPAPLAAGGAGFVPPYAVSSGHRVWLGDQRWR